MQQSDVIVLTLPGDREPTLAIAANRSGAIGCIDLQTAQPGQSTQLAIEKLAQYSGSRWGLLFQPASPVLEWALQLPEKPSHVILSGGDQSRLAETVRRLRETAIVVLFEAISVEEALRGVEAGVSGVILKGHEAGGRIGSDTTFILLQRWRRELDQRQLDLPFWVRGGIGPNTAAACAVGGARGVVLDTQVALCRESSLSETARKRILGMDGSETITLGASLGERHRFYGRPDSPAVKELYQEEERLLACDLPSEAKLQEWQASVRKRTNADPALGVWPVGQDVALAARLARDYVTVAGVVQAICAAVNRQLTAPAGLAHLAESSSLAESHGTRYPILQGPMTRVSDTAEFAAAVAGGGALPFLALALLRKAETEQLLSRTKAQLEDRPWGVGILGFVPAEIRSEQLEAIRTHKPPFAIIAGGRPDQARELESQGIATYLHVPSPGLLRQFVKDGSRRFIFEGLECGGHIGPRASFPLWESMITVILELLEGKRGDDFHIVFAGGIHDQLSARMAAALSAGLAAKGVKVGILIGTAYLFTREAVAAGAITERFQKEALACGETVLLETGPGHAIRCIPTPYAETFEDEKRRLRSAGKSPLEIGIALERMNLGRLRVASKGLDRPSAGDERASNHVGGLQAVGEEQQYSRGMFMIGQVAALRQTVTTIAELHEEICGSLSSPIAANDKPIAVLAASAEPSPPPCDVAIIGLSCFYPRAGSLWQYWENILNKVNAVVEIPPSHWDWRPFYDPDPRARDKIISKWGGFMDDVFFDPLVFGITPKSIPCIEPLQLLLLEAVRQGIADAGYADRPFARERTAAILGVGGGGMPLSLSYGFRACMPLLDSIPNVPIHASEIIKLGEGILPEWTEDSFPGILLNVAAGRVANRFNLGGPNMAIDAACGSSLAALYAGVRELNDGTSDVAIVMGGDAVQTPYAYVAFSKTHALSPKGRCRPFDAAADGIVLAEGIGVAVLKRLADAERDGDRIYSVIKGVGASSDGRDKGLTAPRTEGQLRALQRAYAQARISPARVGLVEAHGTGTVVGDQTEARALGQVFREAGGAPQSCALGSVKSLIGHSKCAAGLAGLIKTTFALYHKVLPPTLVEKPNPNGSFENGPLYLNTEARPWINGANHPRTAAVSAFGFGGTNFHTVLEEYTGDYLNHSASGLRQWPAELLLWRRATVSEIQESLTHLAQALAAGAKPVFADLAAAVWQSSRSVSTGASLAIVATSLEDLAEKLAIARETLVKATTATSDPRGIYFTPSTPEASGTVAFLFPGQGSQYPNMLAQQAMAFAEVREVLDRAESVLGKDLDRPLGRFIYPPSAFSPEQELKNKNELQRTEVAQPAVGATSLAMARLLESLGVTASMLAGHSYGEYVALAVAGALSNDDLVRLSHWRGCVIKEAASSAAGAMAAVDATAATLTASIRGIADLWIANDNSPQQTVIAGSEAAIASAMEKLQSQGLRAQRIPVACAFHTPLVAAARGPLQEAIQRISFNRPRRPVYSNTSAALHSPEPADITRQLVDHLTSPVRFVDEVKAMHEDGARIFIEVGPQGILTALTSQILAGKPHLAIASDHKSRPGLLQLAHLLGQLATAGVPVNLDRLFQGRAIAPLELNKLGPDTGKKVHSATTYVVNGVRSRPLNGPEPRLLGQALPEHMKKPKPAEIQKDAPVKPAAAPVTSNGAASPVPTVANGSTAPGLPITKQKPAAAPTVPPVSIPSPTPLNDVMNPTHNSNHHSPLQASAPEGAAQVMLRFQDVMSRFLETQQNVMLSFLGSPERTPAAVPAVRSGGHGNGHTNGNGSSNGNGHPTKATPLPAGDSLVNRLAAQEPRPRTQQQNHAATPAPVPATQSPATQSPATLERSKVPASPSPETQSQPSTAIERNGKHEATPAASRAAQPTAPLDRDALLAQLLDLVSERTGYPKEALSIDLDLEADLGIDSIKRVEILGTLAESLESNSAGKPPALEMEKLSVIKTLRGIADYLSSALAASVAASLPAAASPAPPAIAAPALTEGVRQCEPQRLVVRLVDNPLPLRPRFVPPAGTILVTDDGGGYARELADRLAELDVNVALIRMASQQPAPRGNYSADLTDPDSVQRMLGEIRQKYGLVAGLIHLLPLAEPRSDEALLERLSRDLKSLYLLTRGLEVDLRESGRSGAAVLLTVTTLGSRMGFGGHLPAEVFSGHGGIAGFTKSLGHEWPEVVVRNVDIDPETSATQLTELLMGELGDPEGPLEVGRTRDRRVTWRCEPGALTKSAPSISLGRNDTILITGGARGITARVALEFAQRYQCRLVLLGSSPLPAEESSETRGLTGVSELKAALMRQLQSDGKTAAPAVVEAAYKRLSKDREITANIAAIRAAGSEVDYRALDVRDEAALRTLITELQSTSGLSGVIHGAGVIEDKLLRDKTPESFDRVIGTKVESAWTMADVLNPASLKFFVLFASITSRYGNRGQSDYAAANEVLSKLACDLDRRWPGRVVSIAWGPWSSVGMVADLEKHLVARGLKLIEPSEGARLCVDEIVYGHKGEPEVIIAGGTEPPARPALVKTKSAANSTLAHEMI